MRLLSRWPRPPLAHSPARHACRLQHGDRQSTPPSLGAFVPFVILSISFPASCAGLIYPSHAATSRAKPPLVCCLTSSLGGVVLRPSIGVGLQSLRSVSFRCSQWRWPSSVMTRLLVRLVEGFPSSAATVLPILPATEAVRGQFVSPLLSFPYVAIRC